MTHFRNVCRVFLHVLVMRALIVIGAIDGVIMVSDLARRVQTGLLDDTRCFESSLARFLVITLRHVHVLVHVITH